jgi:hypothetical protein
MLNYTYQDNIEGGKTLTIFKENGIIIMNLHDSVEGHGEVLTFLESAENLDKYANYLANDPDKAFNLTEILSL